MKTVRTMKTHATDTLPRPAPGDRWALFLDFDGTLVDIAPTPDAVVVPSRLGETLQTLYAALDGALAIVSGRRIADIDAYLAPLRLPAVGQHGIERRPGPGAPVEVSGGHEAALDSVRREFSRFADSRTGVFVEDKGQSFSVHYRQAPDAGPEVEALARRLIDTDGQIRTVSGKMVLDFKSAAADKGRAVEAFLDAAPFAGRTPVFAGDDVTDEDGFAAANARGGHSIRIGAAESGSADTAARWTCPDTAVFAAWLERLAETCTSARGVARRSG